MNGDGEIDARVAGVMDFAREIDARDGGRYGFGEWELTPALRALWILRGGDRRPRWRALWIWRGAGNGRGVALDWECR